MQHKNKNITTSSKTLQRAHSFINRTPYTVLNVCKKSTWKQVVKEIVMAAFDWDHKANQKLICISQAGISIKCLKIEDCSISVQQIEQCKQQTTKIVSQLLPNIQKLTISKFKCPQLLQFLDKIPQYFNPILSSLSLCTQYSNCLQNLQQLYLPYNNVPSLPLFLLSSSCCPVLHKLDISHNRIRTLDFQLNKISQKLKYVDLRNNGIEEITVQFWVSMRKYQVQVQFQWGWHLIGLIFNNYIQTINIQQQSETEKKVMTGVVADSYTSRNTTQADHLTMQDQHVNPISSSSDLPVYSPALQNTIISLPQQILTLFRLEKYQSMFIAQLEQLVKVQHIQYLKYLEQLITYKMAQKYVQSCFKNKKYRSLEYFLELYQKYKLSLRDYVELNGVLTEKNTNFESNLAKTVPEKSIKLNKQNKVAGRKQIRMLQPKSKQNNLIQPSIKLEVQDQYVLHKLISLNLPIMCHIPNKKLQQITTDQLIWFLNQLQMATLQHSKQKVLALFQCRKFQYLVNTVIKGEREFLNIVNTVSYRQAIRDLIFLVDFQFMGYNYDFQSHAILRIILNFDDLQIYLKYKQKYPKFVPALLNPYPYSLTSSSTLFPSPLFKSLLSPTHKLYKHLCNAYRKLTQKVLQSQAHSHHHHYNHNWHFPQYAPEQSIIIHNDVHDYQVLKQYQQFQASFMYKDLKLHIRSNKSHREPQYSVAQKIINQVKDQANKKVRNIGKTRKNMHIENTGQHHKAYMRRTSIPNNINNSIQISQWMNQNSCVQLSKTTDSTRPVKSNSSSLIYPEGQHSILTIQRQQHQTTAKSPSRLRSSRGSIQVLSKLNNTHSKKPKRNKNKNGIFLFSSPQHKNTASLNTVHPWQKIEHKYGVAHKNKILYLDLSKNSNKNGKINKNQQKSQCQNSQKQHILYFDNNNENVDVDHHKINEHDNTYSKNVEVQCSSFDLECMINNNNLA